ncbi:unnamed protein product [Ceutorhynchus assimilis]|uniref:Uncharacterized protein n=1 Tax=Ceutorhynchus assimilis TaxID=467358 RepID=A0A9N9MRG5_9CUCU|nr:unnamed protein product [Ceutorhynchus assimilis]
MNTKLCRTCGKTGQNFINIFRTEGLKYKIETCLPILVTNHSLLPDTICPECQTSVESFYLFTKSCLENILIVEAQLNIQESCLKSKRRQDQGCTASLPLPNQNTFEQNKECFNKIFLPKTSISNGLVDYGIESANDSSEENDETGQVVLGEKLEGQKILNDYIKYGIRSKAIKRKSDSFEDCDLYDTSETVNDSKIKCTKSKNIYTTKQSLENNEVHEETTLDDLETRNNEEKRCILCNLQLNNLAALAQHFIEVHSNESGLESMGETCEEKLKKRSIPSLVKISDLKNGELIEDESSNSTTNISCPNSNCQTTCQTKSQLFSHLYQNHLDWTAYLCGICLEETNSASNLKLHVSNCIKSQPPTHLFYCQVCCFGDNNCRSMEDHVLVHTFLWENCRLEKRNFDPQDYIQINDGFVANGTSPVKKFSCVLCNISDFADFKSFTSHKRVIHKIFHCDLCNKFYGRNSHLWKHVNRIHKNHPSITCQVCFKTSASKYYLSRHFAKLHQGNVIKKAKCDYVQEAVKNLDSTDPENYNSSYDDNYQASQSDDNQDDDDSMDKKIPPRELDPSHNLYTNILTNYSPKSKAKGKFECLKCSKRFLKSILLRTHNKNCRPRSQKDLLTRCKSCSRVFKDRQSLAKHLANYHSDYQCEICTEKVQSKCEIVSHIRFQHPSSHLICSVCENILRSKKELLEHLADHENSFICQFCGDALDSKVKLKMHILSLHRKILNLSCGICLKLFETQFVLREHVMMIHKGQLIPFISCPICGKNYGSKWKTYDHVNKSHGRFFKACKICLEIFDSENQLEMHVNSSHPNQPASKKSSKLNPVAIMRQASIKTEALRVEKSDTEEIENSLTSGSEDDDEEIAVQDKHPHLLDQQSKINLFEKRLFGNSMVLGKCPVNSPSDDLTQEENLVSPKIVKECARKSEHHSKRTVYENSNDPSFCDICHKCWPAKKHLWQHYIRCHKRIAATVCGICLKTNETYEQLQIHLRETHPTLLHGQGIGSNFICRICGRYHNASSKLRLHMVIHEKFDWALLEKFPALLSNNRTKLSKKTQRKQNGKYAGVKKEVNIENEAMYDAMIEQVEESSSDSELENTQGKSPESNDNKPDDKIQHLSFKNFLQALKNHNPFNEFNQIEQNSEAPKENVANNMRAESVIHIIGSTAHKFEDVQNTSQSNLSEDTSSSDSSSDGENDDSQSQSQMDGKDETFDGNVCKFEPEHLNPAIESISDPNNQVPAKTDYVFNESVQQGNCSNETEIESAVGSILCSSVF